MGILLERLDHLVLTVADIDRTVAFYTTILGMEKVTFGGRIALRFGEQKINLHQRGHEFEPKAHLPTPGSADICFLTQMPIAEIMRFLKDAGTPIELGPVERTGATGKLLSIYLRDPDRNLIEISNLV